MEVSKNFWEEMRGLVLVACLLYAAVAIKYESWLALAAMPIIISASTVTPFLANKLILVSQRYHDR